MDKHSPNPLISLLRGVRLALHLCYGMLLATVYPHLKQPRQHRVMKSWNRQLLNILNIDIQIEGPQQFSRGEGGCLIVANHVSWLDIIVLNAIQPSRFIAKSEVRDWPVVGWLCRRSGTIFIERAMRRDAATINRRVSALLKQGICIGLFPEGTTTDGKQVGHFHSALIQPTIDAGTRLCPVALRYQDEDGEPSTAAAFIGDATLTQSIWNILRSSPINALVMFNPALPTANKNRRVLARAAQAAIAQKLQNIDLSRPAATQQAVSAFPQTILSSRSTYALLIDPLLQQPHK
jgi:1-acyl-sn-glycerol-3-phosphate acyltransferase